MNKMTAMLLAGAFLLAGALSASELASPEPGMYAAVKKSTKKTTTKRTSSRSAGGPVSQDAFLRLGVSSYGLPFELGYERMLKSDQSWTAAGSFSSKGDTNWSWTTIGVGGSWRFWLKQLVNEGNLKGVYVGPLVRIQSLTYSYKVPTVNTTTIPYTYGTRNETAGGIFFGAGAEGGYQWIFDNNFMVNGGLELGFLAGSVSVASGGAALGFGGTYGGLTISGGYAF